MWKNFSVAPSFPSLAPINDLRHSTRCNPPGEFILQVELVGKEKRDLIKEIKLKDD